MKNILITGVSGGIGKGLAEALLMSGSSVIGLCRTQNDELNDLCKKYPELFSLHEADLNNVDAIGDLVKSLVNEYGPIGGFVHCAGFDKMAPLHMTKAADYDSLWRIHALVPMLLVGNIAKKQMHRDNTSIVLISSQSAHEGAVGHAAYAAAKGAIEGFLAPAAAELMEKGIRINEINLAPVKTNMSSGWMSKLTPEGLQKLSDSYPLGIGEISDVVGLICFLLGEESRWINGQIITADGGHNVRKA